MRAEIGIVVAQVRGEAIDSNVFPAVGKAHGDELPLFRMHDERLLKCARA